MPIGAAGNVPPQVKVDRVGKDPGGQDRYQITILMNENQLRELQGVAQRSLARRTGPFSHFIRMVEQAIEQALTTH